MSSPPVSPISTIPTYACCVLGAAAILVRQLRRCQNLHLERRKLRINSTGTHVTAVNNVFASPPFTDSLPARPDSQRTKHASQSGILFKFPPRTRAQELRDPPQFFTICLSLAPAAPANMAPFPAASPLGTHDKAIARSTITSRSHSSANIPHVKIIMLHAHPV